VPGGIAEGTALSACREFFFLGRTRSGRGSPRAHRAARRRIERPTCRRCANVKTIAFRQPSCIDGRRCGRAFASEPVVPTKERWIRSLASPGFPEVGVAGSLWRPPAIEIAVSCGPSYFSSACFPRILGGVSEHGSENGCIHLGNFLREEGDPTLVLSEGVRRSRRTQIHVARASVRRNSARPHHSHDNKVPRGELGARALSYPTAQCRYWPSYP
jgi:hypothetical protein